jgi:hypothetical protein
MAVVRGQTERGKEHAALVGKQVRIHAGVELRANLKSISHRFHLFEVAFVWEMTKETINLPLGCLQGGGAREGARRAGRNAGKSDGARHITSDTNDQIVCFNRSGLSHTPPDSSERQYKSST